MIYITVAKNIDEAIPEKFKYKSNFSKSIIYFFRDLFKIILEKNIENKKMYILPNLNKKYIEKIRKIIKIRCVNTVVLSETLRNNKEFFNNIKEENVKILDGKWIYRYIEEKLLDYIMNLKNEKLYTQEVSILVNNFNEINIENIKNIAKKVKVLNIVTKKEKMLRKIERNIYEEDGIILNISNNYKRSLSKSDIIINEDFEIEEFNNYELPKKACIINVEKQINIYSKYFEGINILSFDINIPKRYIKIVDELRDFNSLIMYESLIYKRTSIKNIKEEIEKDKIRVLNLYGQKGRIRNMEFKALNRSVK